MTALTANWSASAASGAWFSSGQPFADAKKRHGEQRLILRAEEILTKSRRFDQ